MAFPTTSVLDDFNTGASQNLGGVRSGWSTPIWTGDSNWQTDAVPTKASPLGADSDVYRSDVSAADTETWAVMATAIGSFFNLWGRITATGSPTGYYCQIISGTWTLGRYIAGTNTQLTPTFSQAVAIGDSVGLECSGSSIRAYYRSGGGAWTILATRTDTSITAAGTIGMEGSSTHSADSFGGGAIVPITIVLPRDFPRDLRGASF